jgi:preprotein translocase subunit SecA
MLASIKTEILSYLFKIQVSQDSRESLDSRTTKAPSQVVYDHKSLGQFDGLSGDRPAVPNIPDQSVAGREAQVPAGITYTRETQKVGRNEPCPCGSGKKYKRCCGKDV